MATFMTTKEALAMGPWLDFSTYIKFEVSFITREDYTGVSRADLSKLRYWFLDNMGGDVIYGDKNISGIGYEYFVYFSEEEDAILFKLSKWYCEELNRKSY